MIGMSECSDDSVRDKDYSPEHHLDESSESDSNSFYGFDVDQTTNNEIEPRKVSAAVSAEEPFTRGRKRVRNSHLWVRNIRKKRKEQGQAYTTYKGNAIPEKVIRSPCKCKRKCSTKFSQEDRKAIFKEFWTVERKVQDQVLSGLIQENPKERERQNAKSETSRRKYSRHYFLRSRESDNEVCQTMFINTFGITVKKARIVAEKKRSHVGSQSSEDKRGKHDNRVKVPETSMDNIRKHIKLFPSYKSHYSRKDSNKKYLDPNLSISEMYRLFKTECQEKGVAAPKEHTYRKVFNEEFNLSFHHPVNDTCYKCDEFKAKLASAKGDEQKKIQDEQAAHYLLAERAYEQKRNDKEHAAQNPNCVTASFDLQKVLPCPYIQTGVVFYKRQLAVYNLTVYETSFSGTKAHCMIWNESIARRGAEEIGSAVYIWLETLPSTVTDIRLYSDSCGGQNRNHYMAAMLMVYSIKKKVKITQIFLEPGHTHMEADTIHAAIESTKKSTSAMIEVPRDWANIIRMVPRKKKLIVVEMRGTDFYHVKHLYAAGGPLIKRKKNTENEEVKWLKIKQIQYGEPGSLFKYKNKIDQEEQWKILEIRKNPKGRNQQLTIKKRDGYPMKIPVKKYKDLLALLPLLTEGSHPFYRNLVCEESLNEEDEYIDDLQEED